MKKTSGRSRLTSFDDFLDYPPTSISASDERPHVCFNSSLNDYRSFTGGQMFELMALFQQYLEAHYDNLTAATEENFKSWLRDEAFPRLLDQSGKMVHSVVALSAAGAASASGNTENEIFSALTRLPEEIKRAMPTQSIRQYRPRLRPERQLLLKHAYDRFAADPFAMLEQTDLSNMLNVGANELYASARYLSDKNLVKLGESQDNWWISPSAAGMETAAESESPGAYFRAMKRVAQVLPSHFEIARLGKISNDAKMSIGLTYFILLRWRDQGRLKFEHNASPWEYSTVWGVSESLRHEYSISGSRDISDS